MQALIRWIIFKGLVHLQTHQRLKAQILRIFPSQIENKIRIFLRISQPKELQKIHFRLTLGIVASSVSEDFLLEP